MPLKIALKAGEKIIINGAVMENVGSGVMKALILNNATILRERDIITEEDARTPASRVYFAIQNLYLFPNRRDNYLPLATRFLSDYGGAAPSAQSLIKEILEAVNQDKLYQALHLARKLVEHEGRVIGHAEQELAAALHEGPDGGESPSD